MLPVSCYVSAAALSLARSRSNGCPISSRASTTLTSIAQFVGWCLLISAVTALVGLIYFSRRDV